MRTALLLTLLASPAAATSFEESPGRHIEIIGVITGSSLDTAARIEELSAENKKDISILINSPGGYVSPGLAVVDAIRLAKKRGVKVRCMVGALAASMAFTILSHCSERYALAHAQLLFHPIWFSTNRMRVFEAVIHLTESQKEELDITKHLQRTLGVGSLEFSEHYIAETLWSAYRLNRWSRGRFLKIVSDTKVANLFTVQKSSPLPFGKVKELLHEKVLRIYHENK